MTTVKQLKEHLDTLDEDAPIAYWLWQVADIEEEIGRLKERSDRWDKDKLNQLTDGDIAYILDSINDCFDDDVVFHAVNHCLDKMEV